MIKEISIIGIIVIIVVFLNSISQNYTNESIDNMIIHLDEVRKEFMKEEEEIDLEKLDEKIEMMKDEWELRYEKFAYYIEHDELEKVYTSIVAIDGLLEKEEYGNAIGELEKGKYTLEHIRTKYEFTLKNIF